MLHYCMPAQEPQNLAVLCLNHTNIKAGRFQQSLSPLVNGNPVTTPASLSCDNAQSGTLQNWSPTTTPVKHVADDLIKYVGHGVGACSVYYRETSHVACMKSGWSTESAIGGNGCKRWIRVENTVNGAKTDAQILDVCTGDNPATFGCEDLFLSERAFNEVAGPSRKASDAAGHLTDKFSWHFQVAPCWTCYAGLGSQLPDGRVDDCTGRDGDGFMRCGVKFGKEIITGQDVKNVCNKDYKCPV